MKHTQLHSSAPGSHAQLPRCVSTRTFAPSCETMECVEVGRNQMQSEDCCLENPLKYLVTEAALLLLLSLILFLVQLLIIDTSQAGERAVQLCLLD